MDLTAPSTCLEYIKLHAPFTHHAGGSISSSMGMADVPFGLNVDQSPSQWDEHEFKTASFISTLQVASGTLINFCQEKCRSETSSRTFHAREFLRCMSRFLLSLTQNRCFVFLFMVIAIFL